MFRPGKWIGAGLVVLAAGVLGGCLTEADRNSSGDTATAPSATGETWVEAWDASGAPGLPTLDELTASLSLTTEQAAVLQSALQEWARQMEQRRNVRGHGVPGGFGDFEAPLLRFLESVVPGLDASQVNGLATILEQRREQLGPPEGGPGGGGGPGGPGHPGGPGLHGPGGPGFGGPIADVLRELRDELDLDATQRDALHTLLMDSRETFHALRESFANGEITAEQLRDAAHEARVTLESQLAGILSDDQYTLLMNALATHRTEMATRRLEHLDEGVQRRLDFLTAVLSLDDAQTTQVGVILADSVTQRRALLEALRDGTIEIEDALYQGYLIAESTTAAIRDVLTAEQQAIFDSLKRLLPGNRGPHGP